MQFVILYTLISKRNFKNPYLYFALINFCDLFFILFIWVCVICGYNVWPNYCIIRTVNGNKFTLSQLEFFWFKPFPVYSNDCIGVWPHILEECRVESTEHNKKKSIKIDETNVEIWIFEIYVWNLFNMFLYVFEVKYWLFGLLLETSNWAEILQMIRVWYILYSGKIAMHFIISMLV